MNHPKNRICTIARIRTIEKKIFASTNSFDVMCHAANRIAHTCMFLPEPIFVVAGNGNNGGDAILATTYLKAHGKDVRLCLPLGKPKKASDAAIALRLWFKEKNKLETNCNFKNSASIVDGLFGIGLDRDLTEDAANCVKKINAAKLPVLAIDVPSGLCSDSGQVLGVAVKASVTVSFFANKPGLVMSQGRDLCGEIFIDDLGYPQQQSLKDGQIIDTTVGIDPLLRVANSHKGSFGSLQIVGGSKGMLGALYLATRTAVAHGAGKVFAKSLSTNAPSVDPQCPEVMWQQGTLSKLTALAVGVGLGTSQDAKLEVEHAIVSNLALVLDADALNIIAKSKKLLSKLRLRKKPTVLTPHLAEAARMLGVTTQQVQQQRIICAKKLAKKTNCVVILKGAGSVIADPKEKWGICNAGNAGLAQAGSGDVLTGIVASLLAQKMSAWDASASACWLHAKAADMLLHERGGSLGIPLAEIISLSSRILACQVEEINT